MNSMWIHYLENYYHGHVSWACTFSQERKEHSIIQGMCSFSAGGSLFFFNSTSTHLVGGWTNPSETYESSNWILDHGSFHQVWLQIKGVFELPPPIVIPTVKSSDSFDFYRLDLFFVEQKNKNGPRLAELVEFTETTKAGQNLLPAKGGSVVSSFSSGGSPVNLRNLFELLSPLLLYIRRATKKSCLLYWEGN